MAFPTGLLCKGWLTAFALISPQGGCWSTQAASLYGELPWFERIAAEDFGQCVPELDTAWSLFHPVAHPTRPRASAGSCAVVASSDSLLGSRFGAAIDAHDTVIRFNMPPAERRYEADVGAKTTAMFSHGSNFHPAQAPKGVKFSPMNELFDNKIEAYLRLAPRPLPTVTLTSMCAKCRLLDLSCAGKCAAAFCSGLLGCRERGFNCRVLGIEPARAAFLRFREEFHPLESKEGAKPGTGWIGIFWANMSCSSVDVYGFPLQSTGRHYYAAEDKATGMAREFNPKKHDNSGENMRLRGIFDERRVKFWEAASG